MDKTKIDVIIDEKVYSISSEQDAAYVRQLAAYVNEKLEQIRNQKDYSRQPYGIKQAMLLMNFADDYFRVKQQADEAKRLYSEQETNFYNMKREMVSMQLKLEQIRASHGVDGDAQSVQVLCPYLKSLEDDHDSRKASE